MEKYSVLLTDDISVVASISEDLKKKFSGYFEIKSIGDFLKIFSSIKNKEVVIVFELNNDLYFELIQHLKDSIINYIPYYYLNEEIIFLESESQTTLKTS